MYRNYQIDSPDRMQPSTALLATRTSIIARPGPLKLAVVTVRIRELSYFEHISSISCSNGGN